MELSSILKTLINNLKKYYIIFISTWIIIGIVLFLTIFKSQEIFGYLYLLYIFSSCFFCFILGTLAYGSYAKTFILIQNDRKCYVLANLIFGLINTLVFTVLALILRLKSSTYSFDSMSVLLLILLFLAYLLIYNFGCLYGLFVKYNKNIKRFVLILLFIFLIVLGIFVSSLNFEFITSIIDFKIGFDKIVYILIFGILNCIFAIICSIYYLRLNILKAYSIE